MRGSQFAFLLTILIAGSILPATSVAVDYRTEWFRAYVATKPDYLYGMKYGNEGWAFLANVTEVLRGNVTSIFPSGQAVVFYETPSSEYPVFSVGDRVIVVGHIASKPCMTDQTKLCTAVAVTPRYGEAVQIQRLAQCKQAWWRNIRVVSESYPMGSSELVSLLPSLIRDYGLEFLAITVNWSGGDSSNPPGSILDVIHDNGALASSSLNELNQEWDRGSSFVIQYYNRLSEDQKWRFPNGTITNDPYELGMGRTFSGFYTWFGGTPEAVMTPANPFWVQFKIDCVKDQIRWGVDAIYIDSLSEDPFTHTGDFSSHGGWGEYDFQQYLSSKYSPAELSGLGVADVTHFSFHDYLLRTYHPNVVDRPGAPQNVTSGSPYYNSRDAGRTLLEFQNPAAVLQDPIVKEWVILQYETKLSYLEKIADFTHSSQSSRGCEISFFGETHPLWGDTLYYGSNPFAAAHAGVEDIVWITDNAPLPPTGRNTGGTKLGLALSKDGVVWNRIGVECGSGGSLGSDCPYGKGWIDDVSNYLKIRFAEAYAAGGVPMLRFKLGESLTSTYPFRTQGTYRLISGNERPELAKYTRFVLANKDVFLDLSPFSSVGLVYSLPSLFWDYVPAFRMWGGDDPHYAEFLGSMRVLEESHTPYDVLAFGMPGILNDSRTLSRLSSYSVIILPSVTHLSQTQAEALVGYVNGGGKLLIEGSFGTSDEMNSYPNTTLAALLTKLRTSGGVKQVGGLGSRYELSVEDSKPDKYSYDSLRSAVVNLLSGNLILTTDAPPTVYVGTFLDESTGRLVIHLVNYDYSYNSKSDTVKPAGPIKLHIRIPARISTNSVTLLDPDTNSTRPLGSSISGQYMDVEIPSLAIWNVILIGPRLKIQTAETTASTTAITTMSLSSSTGTTMPEKSPPYEIGTTMMASVVAVIIASTATYILLKRKERRAS